MNNIVNIEKRRNLVQKELIGYVSLSMFISIWELYYFLGSIGYDGVGLNGFDIFSIIWDISWIVFAVVYLFDAEKKIHSICYCGTVLFYFRAVEKLIMLALGEYTYTKGRFAIVSATALGVVICVFGGRYYVDEIRMSKGKENATTTYMCRDKADEQIRIISNIFVAIAVFNASYLAATISDEIYYFDSPLYFGKTIVNDGLLMHNWKKADIILNGISIAFCCIFFVANLIKKDFQRYVAIIVSSYMAISRLAYAVVMIKYFDCLKLGILNILFSVGIMYFFYFYVFGIEKKINKTDNRDEKKHLSVADIAKWSEAGESKSQQLLYDYQRKIISEKTFFSEFGKENVFYSTPFGSHEDGSTRLFLLQGPDNTGYLPVFITEEHLIEFNKKTGRNGFMILDNAFASVLETTKKTNDDDTPVKMGVIIEPGYYDVTVDVDGMEMVIKSCSE